MMVFVDDKPVDLEGEALGELLFHAQQQAKADGRVIVEVRVDGQLVIGDELLRRRGDVIAGADVRLTSADPLALASETLYGLRGHLERAGQMQQEAAELLQQDDLPQAMGRIGKAIEVWQHSSPAVLQIAELVGIDCQTLEVHGQTFPELTEALMKRLTDMRDLLMSRDSVALADSLMYEWPDAVEQWRGVVDALLDRVAAKREG
jgi:hypothetical protein